jgi:hypothetical protein
MSFSLINKINARDVFPGLLGSGRHSTTQSHKLINTILMNMSRGIRIPARLSEQDVGASVVPLIKACGGVCMHNKQKLLGADSAVATGYRS